MKKLLLTTFLALVPATASAQCNGVFAPNSVCGRGAAEAAGTPHQVLASALGIGLVVGTTTIAGGTTTAPLWNNAGILANSAIGATWVSFLQTGTGAQTITLDTLLRAKVVTPEMFKATATCDGTDDGPAIQRAVTYAGSLASKAEVRLSCSYAVVTPIVDAAGIDLVGQSMFGPQINFAPSGSGQIAYRVRSAGTVIFGGSIRNIGFYTFDTTNTKTAIEIEDVSNYTIENVTIRGSTVSGGTSYWGGGGNSIGLSIKGREYIRGNRITSFAERPLVIADNPNSTIDNDWGDYRNLSLTTYADLKNFEINDGVNYTHMSIDGISCVKGAYCIYNNDTTAVQISQGLSIKNIGSEQSTASVAANSGNVWIKRPASGTLYQLTVGGSNIFDPARNGVVLRNVTSPIIGGVEFESSASYSCFDTANTVLGLSWDSSTWRGCVATLTGQTLTVSGSTQAGYSLPRWAKYASSTEDATLLSPSYGVLGSSSNLSYLRAQASPAGNIVLLPSSSGTLAATASSPLAINAVTGNATCTTCVTSSGGGAISGTAPISVSAAGVVSLDAAGVTYAKIQNLGPLAVMGRSANSSGVGADIQATAASDGVFRESGSVIGFGTIATGGIANNAVTLAKLATQATNTVLGNATSGTAVPTALTMTSCSTAASALIWTTNTGFGCNTSITAAAVPASGLTGTTLAANVVTSSLTALGTITSLTATTINAFTLGGTISGGGNQLNNIIIGTTTPLAITGTTIIANTSISSPIHLSSGSLTFQSNGSTFAGGITTGQKWFLGTNVAPPANGVALTVNYNAAALPGIASLTDSLLNLGQVDSTTGFINIQTFSGAAVFSFPGIRYLKARGTGAAPSQVQNGDFLGANLAYGYSNSGAYVTSAGSGFVMSASEPCTSSACGALLQIYTTVTGSASNGVAATFQASGGLSIGTTTDPGIGSLLLNAQAFIPNMTSDTATTDNSVCIQTGGGGKLLKGTGALGVCLGTSSARYKHDVGLMNAGLADIIKLVPKNFYYNKGFGDDGFRQQYGFIAEDVIEVIPGLVGIDKDNRPNTVDMLAMVPIMVNSIKELKATNDNIQAELKRMNYEKDLSGCVSVGNNAMRCPANDSYRASLGR